MADEKLVAYTTGKLADAKLPSELAAYVKGADEADTDARLKVFKAAFDKGVQAGVEARFQTNGYLPKGSGAAAPPSEVVTKLMELFTQVKDDSGEDVDLVCFISMKNEQAFRDASKNNNNAITFGKTIAVNGSSYTKCMDVNGLPCVFVPSKRLQTLVKVNDGRTAGQEAGGIETDADAEQIEFMIMSSDAPIACGKIDSLKVFDADIIQNGDETTINYHLLYDLWTLENRIVTLAACVRAKT